MQHQVPWLPRKVPPLSRNQFLKLSPSLGSPSVKEPFSSCSAARRKMLTCHRDDTTREKKIWGEKILVNVNLLFSQKLGLWSCVAGWDVVVFFL